MKYHFDDGSVAQQTLESETREDVADDAEAVQRNVWIGRPGR